MDPHYCLESLLRISGSLTLSHSRYLFCTFSSFFKRLIPTTTLTTHQCLNPQNCPHLHFYGWILPFFLRPLPSQCTNSYPCYCTQGHCSNNNSPFYFFASPKFPFYCLILSTYNHAINSSILKTSNKMKLSTPLLPQGIAAFSLVTKIALKNRLNLQSLTFCFRVSSTPIRLSPATFSYSCSLRGYRCLPPHC